MADTKIARYSTPLIYTNGLGKDVNKTLHFELDPLEFLDWTVNNRFEANELQAGLLEIQRAGLEQKDRDLNPDEVTTLLNIIKILVQLSAGRPDDAGEYFLKDPNWTSSYAYRGFRTFLLEKPKEMNQFLESLLNNDIMEKFAETIAKANDDAEAETPKSAPSTARERPKAEVAAEMRRKLAELESEESGSSV
jgi:hypothetical protein